MGWNCLFGLLHQLFMKESDKKLFSLCSGSMPEVSVYLHPGEYHFATVPTVIHTVLGSCVSIVLFNEIKKIGAMCHAVMDMEPASTQSKGCYHYVDCVFNEMLENFAEYGVAADRLMVKLFGGSRLLQGRNSLSNLNPGNKNILMAKKIIQEYGYQVVTEDCGGSQGRKIFFCTHTGEVFLKRIKKSKTEIGRMSL